LLCLDKVVLEQALGGRIDACLARRPERLPVVLTRDEVRAILDPLDGEKDLMASSPYGSGLRLMEWLRLRGKDVDFGWHFRIVRDGNGQRDRVTLLPRSQVEPSPGQITGVRRLERFMLGLRATPTDTSPKCARAHDFRRFTRGRFGLVSGCAQRERVALQPDSTIDFEVRNSRHCL
jgi:integrase